MQSCDPGRGTRLERGGKFEGDVVGLERGG